MVADFNLPSRVREGSGVGARSRRMMTVERGGAPTPSPSRMREGSE